MTQISIQVSKKTKLLKNMTKILTIKLQSVVLFSGKLHIQIDGFAMVRLLAPILAKLAGNIKTKLVTTNKKKQNFYSTQGM